MKLRVRYNVVMASLIVFLHVFVEKNSAVTSEPLVEDTSMTGQEYDAAIPKDPPLEAIQKSPVPLSGVDVFGPAKVVVDTPPAIAASSAACFNGNRVCVTHKTSNRIYTISDEGKLFTETARSDLNFERTMQNVVASEDGARLYWSYSYEIKRLDESLAVIKTFSPFPPAFPDWFGRFHKIEVAPHNFNRQLLLSINQDWLVASMCCNWDFGRLYVWNKDDEPQSNQTLPNTRHVYGIVLRGNQLVVSRIRSPYVKGAETVISSIDFTNGKVGAEWSWSLTGLNAWQFVPLPDTDLWLVRHNVVVINGDVDRGYFVREEILAKYAKCEYSQPKSHNDTWMIHNFSSDATRQEAGVPLKVTPGMDIMCCLTSTKCVGNSKSAYSPYFAMQVLAFN